ncbi:hypothetical protein C8R44DRAFT_875581 [Mycena epipterygia]|nr:hypothetical protein C8R44DRAFT_875581 [Mycena epipterygia]
MAGIPTQPGEDPGVSITFSMDVQIFGKNQSVEILFDVVAIGWYEIYENTEIETLCRELIKRIGPELTHNSETWACLECGGVATDIEWLSTYTHAEMIYKRCKILISAACKKCARKMQRASLKFTAEHNAKNTGKYSTVFGTIPRPDGLSGGLSGACLTCRKEQTAAPEFTMSRCAKCKLVRYCSVACQTEDWARHKTICRKIKNVSRSGGEKKVLKFGALKVSGIVL